MLTLRQEHSDAGVTFPEGFVAEAVRCGLKTTGSDLALLASDRMAAIAGVFTTNRVQAACVKDAKRVIQSGQAQAVLINAGNANTCNGNRGDADNRTLTEWVTQNLHLTPDAVVIASTGIIGHPLPMDKLKQGVQDITSGQNRSEPINTEAASLVPVQARSEHILRRGRDVDMAVARAIMTTDTCPKLCAVEVKSDHWPEPIRLGGTCKGSGMIAPNMATMLAFVTTDVCMPAPLLQEALNRAVAVSFNSITVDGDTSTNDMCLLLASGAGKVEIAQTGDGYEDFVAALTRLCITLAKTIVCDGEGATKLVEVVIQGAATHADARQIAKTIAESPLVKTALFGADPNWGRLMMAAGRAGVPICPERIDIHIGDHLVCMEGGSVAFDRQAAHETLQRAQVRIQMNLNMGEASATVWTCDLTDAYIQINTAYHT